jgi:hypothetical protein
MKVTPRLLLAVSLLALLAGGCSKKKPVAVGPDEQPRTAEAPAKQAAGMADRNAPRPPRDTDTPAPESAAPASTAPATEGIPADLAAQDVAYEAWFKKHKLDLSDPKMLDEDPDNDGFTNREEFLADTDPRDPNSRPGIATGIRLKEFVRKDLPFVLKAVQGQTAEIERGEDGAGAKKRESVKAGQSLAGSNYKVVRVQQRQLRDKDGNPMDGSRVTLEDTQSKQHIDLVKDLPARSTASYAVLAGTDGKTITVHDGETFTWPGATPVTYKVKDLRAEQVILEEVSTGKTVTVPKE